mgnify:CR=1 FL=1
MGNDLQKKYGLPTAIALVVGIVIGMRRETTLGVFQRFVMPALSIACCIFFCAAAIVSHGRDVLAYLSVFAAVMALSIPFYRIDEQMTSGEVIGVLSRMTAVVSMRLHGLIFAAGQGVPLIGVAYDPKVTAFLDYVEQNNYMQFEALNEKDLSDLIDSAVALAGRGEELRRRTELLNRQEDNNRATAARLLGKE